MRERELQRPQAGAVTSDEPVIAARGVYKRFCRDYSRSLRYAVVDILGDMLPVAPAARDLRRDEFWALADIDFEVRPGESVGVMGANGAGKSTLLKLLLGTLRLNRGEIVTRGGVAALTEQGIGFDPDLSGRENVFLGAAVLGVDRHRVERCFDDIVRFAGIEAFIDSHVRYYSTGMRARLGFAVAMYLEPDLLMVDEVLAVGDVGFQRRCIDHVRRYLGSGGSLLLVSHNPLLVQTLCDRCLVLDAGRLVYDGDAVGGVDRYCELLRAAPAGSDDADAAILDPSAVSVREEAYPAQAVAGAGGRSEAAVDITAFGIRPLEGTTLGTGEPAQVFVRYTCHESVTARWGFCLLLPDLGTTIACEGRMAPMTLRPGVGELAGNLAALPLTGGSYALRVAVTDPGNDLPYASRGYADPPLYFRVEMPVNRRNNYRRFANDLIVLDGVTWHHETGIADDVSAADSADLLVESTEKSGEMS